MKNLDHREFSADDISKYDQTHEQVNIRNIPVSLLNENILAREVTPFLGKIRQQDIRQADANSGDDPSDLWCGTLSYFEEEAKE